MGWLQVVKKYAEPIKCESNLIAPNTRVTEMQVTNIPEMEETNMSEQNTQVAAAEVIHEVSAATAPAPEGKRASRAALIETTTAKVGHVVDAVRGAADHEVITEGTSPAEARIAFGEEAQAAAFTTACKQAGTDIEHLLPALEAVTLVEAALKNAVVDIGHEAMVATPSIKVVRGSMQQGPLELGAEYRQSAKVINPTTKQPEDHYGRVTGSLKVNAAPGQHSRIKERARGLATSAFGNPNNAKK